MVDFSLLGLHSRKLIRIVLNLPSRAFEMREQLVRQWQIVMLLSEHRRGLRTVQIAERLSASRASVDRDLKLLRNAGVPIEKETINGETRHRFNSKPLPPLQPTPLQLAALQMAKLALTPLKGTRLLREIDELLGGAGLELPKMPVSLDAGHARDDVVRTIDGAIEHGRRVRLVYAAASHAGERREYEVDPVGLRLVKQDLYLAAYDRRSQAARRFKILRVCEATMLDAKSDRHPELNDDELYGRGIKIWSGDLHHVEVHLSPEVAHLANEYPLARDQGVEHLPDGRVRITARVAGLVEVKQRVLGWGSYAVAVAPPELRAAIKAELTKASAQYQNPPPKPIRPLAKRKMIDPTATPLQSASAAASGTSSQLTRVPLVRSGRKVRA